MNMTIEPSSLSGMIPAVASKSMAHRLLILSSLSDGRTDVDCGIASEDIEATRRCLAALLEDDEPVLDCGESGSTLRFLLPVAGALGKSARFVRRGRLPKRPLAPLDEQLRAHGMSVSADGNDLSVSGQLHGGRFSLPGDVSSQFVSGLLMAAPLVAEPSELFVSTPIQSRPYIDLTIEALGCFGVDVVCDRVGLGVATCERFALVRTILLPPHDLFVEGDWSNAAFWLAAGALEAQGVAVSGLNLMSSQGDRTILAALAAFGARIARQGMCARATSDTPRAASLDVSAIPDLVPPLAAVAATAPGTSRFSNAGRLRLKESDRLQSVVDAIVSCGGKARIEGDALVIEGVSQLRSATIDAFGDHRIAMMAAVMATHAEGPIEIRDADCVRKSYPTFWDDYRQLGGKASPSVSGS